MFNYEISREKRERGGKCGLKARFFYGPCYKKASLRVASEWAVFHQTHLGVRSAHSWGAVCSVSQNFSRTA